MPTQSSKPTRAQRLDIRCNVADAMVANVAVHIVFFFNRHLNAHALSRALARALTNYADVRGANDNAPWRDANSV